MKLMPSTLALLSLCMLMGVVIAAEKAAPAALNFKMKRLNGEEVDLSQYKGKVVLIVNVASECGYTGQYKPLQDLYKKHGKDGLAVLAFPSRFPADTAPQ